MDGCPNGPKVWSLVCRALERKYKEKNRIPSAQLKIRKKKTQPVTNFRALEEEKQSRHVAVRAAERKALTSGPGNSEDFFRYKEERKTVIAGNVL